MSVEYAEYEQPLHVKRRSPERLIAESDAARQMFEDFMMQYVGDPSEFERARGRVPEIWREAEDGLWRHYSQQCYSGYSRFAGNLVHVRKDPLEPDSSKQFFVVTGNLESATLEERAVADVEHILTPQHALNKTIIYLEDPETDEFEREFHPQVIFTANQGYHYYPGGDHVSEQLGRIDTLHGAALGRLTHLALVHSS